MEKPLSDGAVEANQILNADEHYADVNRKCARKGLWKPSMEIGIQEIDRDHRHIGWLVGLLGGALEGRNCTSAWRLIDMLDQKASAHFEREARILQSLGIPLTYDDRTERVCIQWLFEEFRQAVAASCLDEAAIARRAIEEAYIATIERDAEEIRKLLYQ